MTAERIPGADWPATVTVAEGWYGVRIDGDHGSEVRYVDARALLPGSSAAEQRHDTPKAAGSTPALGTTFGPAHRGAACEAA